MFGKTLAKQSSLPIAIYVVLCLLACERLVVFEPSGEPHFVAFSLFSHWGFARGGLPELFAHARPLKRTFDADIPRCWLPSVELQRACVGTLACADARRCGSRDVGIVIVGGSAVGAWMVFSTWQMSGALSVGLEGARSPDRASRRRAGNQNPILCSGAQANRKRSIEQPETTLKTTRSRNETMQKWCAISRIGA